jgi:predicted kinase
MKPTCYVMVGIPAVGKSTFINESLLPMLGKDAFVYSTDNFIEHVAKSGEKTYDEVFRETIDEATRTMNSWLNIAIHDKRDIVWDQTNLGRKKREKIVRRLTNAGYRVEAICFMHPKAEDFDWIVEWRNRLSSRAGKTIPEHVLENMMNSFTVPTKDEGFETVTFYDMYGELTYV